MPTDRKRRFHISHGARIERAHEAAERARENEQPKPKSKRRKLKPRTPPVKEDTGKLWIARMLRTAQYDR